MRFFAIFFLMAFSFGANAWTAADCGGGIYATNAARNAAAKAAGQALPGCGAGNGSFGAIQFIDDPVLGFGESVSPSCSGVPGSGVKYCTFGAGTSCPSGYENDGTGRCLKSCGGGQVRQPDNSCACPDGQAMVSGSCSSTCPDLGFGAEKVIGKQCKPDCAGRAGRKVGAMWPHDTMSGCKVTCVMVVGSAWPMECTYAGSGNGSSNSEGSPTVSGAAPPEGSTPKTPTSTPCPVNTSAGTVNGQQYCAPDSGSPPSEPVQPGQPQTTTTKSETVETRTSTTTTNADGSTTTVTRIVVTGTGTQSGATQGNTGSGGGSGEGGAGECDPTSKEYLECIGKSTLPDHTQNSAQSFGEALNNFYQGVKGTPLGQLASGAGLGGSLDGGSCPAPTLNLFGQSFSMDVMCTLYDSIAPTLAMVLMACFIAAGVLIILSA